MPGEPGERERVAAHRHAEPGQLGEPARHQRGLRVVAVAETVGDARADREHVLQRARHLAADDVGVRVHAEASARRTAAASPRRPPASVIATTDAVGCPAATSRARFGPVSTPTHAGSCPTSTSHATSVMRASVPCSMPLARLTTGTSRPDERARVAEHRAQPVRRHAEHEHVGAGARLLERSGRVQATRAAGCRAGTSGSRARRGSAPRARAGAPTTSSATLPAAIAATAVPHDPAPTTATRVTPVSGARRRSPDRATTTRRRPAPGRCG